ncbi:MAG: DUF421 domain-containing protein [Cyanophyceae cyanobacterium]
MFSDLNPFVEITVTGIIAYLAIIFLLRVSGKRTLSKWNSFDFVITIAFGSILASVLLSTSDTFGKGILGFALLVLFQYAITWISVRSSIIQKLIKSEPALLLYQGEMRQDMMKRERIAEGEILAALRANGVSAIEEADAVILETDGSFSVIETLANGSASALKDVRGIDRTTVARTNEKTER